MRFAVGIGVVLRQRTALTASTGYGRSFRRWGIRPAGTHGGLPLFLYSILLNPIRTGRRKTHHTIDAVCGQGWRRAGKRSVSHLTTSYPQSAHQYATRWALTLMIRSADTLPAGQSAARMAALLGGMSNKATSNENRGHETAHLPGCEKQHGTC